ncbi:MAG: OmpH family outer membrane protein [Phycisphaerales bacterium]|nr:MAG: OmpH family outer membrane protein [Phycisphaerales bacterium]
MKIRTAIVLSCLVSVVVMCIGYQSGGAEPKATGSSLKVGTVNMGEIFRVSQRYAKHMSELMAEQAKARAELEQIAKEIAVAEAELRTLKPGTSDHLKQTKLLLEERANLNVRQEYLKQEGTLNNKQRTEEMYQDILKITRDVAEEKGLDMVLEGGEPKFPVASEQLMLVISTHKLLYSAGCVDISTDIVARLDAAP